MLSNRDRDEIWRPDREIGFRPQETQGQGDPSCHDPVVEDALNMLCGEAIVDVRRDKIARIREEIAEGTYDADGKKLEAATDELFDELST